MKWPLLLALTLVTLVADSSGAQLRTQSTSIGFPDGSRMHCSGVESAHGSTTRCQTFPETAGRGIRSQVEVQLAPELEEAWNIAYRYLKKAQIRRGWKPRVRGPLGVLVIDTHSVSLGHSGLDRADWEVEPAIWHLTCRHLGLTPERIEAGTRIVRR